MAEAMTATCPTRSNVRPARVYPNETIRSLLERKSTRRFSTQPVDPALVELVIACGDKAPSALGKRDPLLVASTDAEVNLAIGKLNRALSTERERGLATQVSVDEPSIIDDPAIEDGFYGAPAMVYAFSPDGWDFAREDAGIAADAMMLAAQSLGLASCYVSRAAETFAEGFPREWARAQGIPNGYHGAFCLCLGHATP